MLFALQVDWDVFAKTYGPLGVVFMLAVVGIIAGAKMVRSLIMGTIEDARRERDYMRQQREREATAFIQALKDQGELMKDGFDEVLREMRDHRRK